MKNEWGLTPQQDAFAVALASGTVTQADAYREAYPKSKNWDEKALWSKSSTLAADARVKERVRGLRERAADIAVLDSAAILRELHRLAFSNPKGIYKEDGTIKLPHELDDATAASIKKFKIDELGRIEYEFHDKRGSLDMAMKHRGLYKEDNSQKPPTVIERIELVALEALTPTAKETKT